MNARRWPPGDKAASAPWAGTGLPPDGPVAAEIVTAIGDLSGLLRQLAPRVLGAATYQLDARGQASDQYRLPFAAIAITSFSAQKLVLAAMPIQAAAPGNGPGITIVPPNAFRLVNLAGYTWSVYGGTQGDQICVEVLSRPQPPAAAKLV